MYNRISCFMFQSEINACRNKRLLPFYIREEPCVLCLFAVEMNKLTDEDRLEPPLTSDVCVVICGVSKEQLTKKLKPQW